MQLEMLNSTYMTGELILPAGAPTRYKLLNIFYILLSHIDIDLNETLAQWPVLTIWVNSSITFITAFSDFSSLQSHMIQ